MPNKQNKTKKGIQITLIIIAAFLFINSPTKAYAITCASVTGTIDNPSNLADYSLASSFTVSSDCYPTQLTVPMDRWGTPPASVTAYLYVDNGGEPTGSVLDSSDALSTTGWVNEGSQGSVAQMANRLFIFHQTAHLVPATTYWIRFLETGTDSNNTHRWGWDSTHGTAYYSLNGGAWSSTAQSAIFSLTGSTTPITPTPSPTSTTTATTTDVLYADWLLMETWQLALLGLIAGGFFFQLFKKRTTWT